MIDRPEGPLRTEVLTWTDVDRLIDLLTPQIKAAGSFTAMILITRGGVIPGGMLAEALQIEHLLTAAVDFPSTAAGLMSWPSFLQFPDNDLIRGRRTLIVDDVWGSGRTSISVRERVESAGGEPFTCVLHFNPYRSLFKKEKPDFYAATTDAFVIYPWEIDRGLRRMGMFSPEPEAN
jgi:hypoxanthine phosphoribosyltransferase